MKSRHICIYNLLYNKILMKYLKHFILYIVIGSLLLYVVAEYMPGLGFSVQSEYKDVYLVFLFLWILSWLINIVIKGILKLITFPITALTFWLFSLGINFTLLYVFEQFVNYLDVWVIVTLWSVVQVAVLSFVLSAVYFLIKKI